MTDAIPDNLISEIVDWLLCKAALTDESLGEAGVVREAWKTLALLGDRLNTKQATNVVKVAMSHPSWRAVPKPPRVLVTRIEILKALCTVAHALSKRLPKNWLRKFYDSFGKESRMLITEKRWKSCVRLQYTVARHSRRSLMRSCMHLRSR